MLRESVEAGFPPLRTNKRIVFGLASDRQIRKVFRLLRDAGDPEATDARAESWVYSLGESEAASVIARFRTGPTMKEGRIPCLSH